MIDSPPPKIVFFCRIFSRQLPCRHACQRFGVSLFGFGVRCKVLWPFLQNAGLIITWTTHRTYNTYINKHTFFSLFSLLMYPMVYVYLHAWRRRLIWCVPMRAYFAHGDMTSPLWRKSGEIRVLQHAEGLVGQSLWREVLLVFGVAVVRWRGAWWARTADGCRSKACVSKPKSVPAYSYHTWSCIA